MPVVLQALSGIRVDCTAQQVTDLSRVCPQMDLPLHTHPELGNDLSSTVLKGKDYFRIII